jgi:hypothetical protein
MTTLPWFGALLSDRREPCLSTVLRALCSQQRHEQRDVTSRRAGFYNVFAAVRM